MISIKSKVVLKILLGLVLFFAVLHVFVYLLVRYNILAESQLSIVDLNDENNLPTFFATILLFLASGILLLLALRGKQKFYWYFLSGVFCFLALDENISIHENLDILTRSALNTETHGLLFFAWTIPYGIILIFLGLFLYKFIWNLPKRTKILFITSGIIFVSGAMGMEMISGVYAESQGFLSRAFRLLTFFEEIFEMVGVSLFIFALLDFIERKYGGLVISMKKQVSLNKTNETISSAG